MRYIRKPKVDPPKESPVEVKVVEVAAPVNEERILSQIEAAVREASTAAAERAIAAHSTGGALRATFDRDKHERIRSFDVSDSAGIVIARGKVERDAMGYMVAISINRSLQ